MAKMKYEALITYFSRIEALTEEEIELISAKLRKRKYLKGQYLTQQGDVCRVNSFVEKGCTRTFYLDDDGQEHTVMFSIEDWWSAELGSYISQEPADFHIQCIEDTQVIQISYEDQLELFDQVPKLDRIFRKILERALVASQKRIIRNFSLTAKERYEVFCREYPSIEQRIPQYMVASYLGITKEFLSKIRSQR